MVLFGDGVLERLTLFWGEGRQDREGGRESLCAVEDPGSEDLVDLFALSGEELHCGGVDEFDVNRVVRSGTSTKGDIDGDLVLDWDFLQLGL